MRILFIILIGLNTFVYAQDSLKIDKNFKGERFLIFEKATKGKTFKAQEFNFHIESNKKGVLFFYPEIDSIKRKHYDNQVRQIAGNKRFLNARILGIPFIESKTDEENVHLEKFIVTNVQCVIYCEKEEELDRALKLNPVFLKTVKDMPPNFYLIEINKESLCVKEDRVAFYESLLLEFVDPQWSEKEKSTMILKNQEELLKKVEVQSKEIQDLKKQVQDLIQLINTPQNVGGKKQ